MDNQTVIIAIVIALGILGAIALNKKKKPKPVEVKPPVTPPKPKLQKTIIDTDFGTRENDNAQWVMVLRHKMRELVGFVCTGCEEFNGTAKLKELTTVVGYAGVPVVVGTQAGFDAHSPRSEAVRHIINVIETLAPDEYLEYRCGGYSYTLQELALQRPDLCKKVRVFWIASSNKTWDEVYKRFEKVLYTTEWYEFFEDNIAFRGMQQQGEQHAIDLRKDLFDKLYNHPRIGKYWRKYPIEEKAYPFKCGDALLDFFAYGDEFHSIFTKKGNYYYTEESQKHLMSHIANNFQHIHDTILDNVDNPYS